MIILFAASGAFRMFFASIIMSTSRPRTRGGSQLGPAHRNLFCIIALLGVTLYLQYLQGLPLISIYPTIDLTCSLRSHHHRKASWLPVLLTHLPPDSSSFFSEQTKQQLPAANHCGLISTCQIFFVFRNSQFYSFSSM